MAEEVKIKIGSALPLEKEEKIEVRGRNSLTGLPKTVEISSREVTEASTQPLSQIIGVVKNVLEETPPELSSDIIDKGIVMTGGTSLLRNLDKLLTAETGVPAHVAQEPLFCVAYGAGIAIENLDMYKRAITKR